MLDLEMRQLEYFVTAASAGSYAQAAKQLFVSPQAISKSVQILEGRIGVALFERGPNGIALTPFGETFARESELVLKSLERLQNMAEQHRVESISSFSAGIHSLCFREHGGTIDWNDLLEFHESNKDITPSFLEMRGDSIIESVALETLDFGISVLPRKGLDSFECILLKQFPMAALIPKGNDRFAARETATIEELTDGQLVLFSEEKEFNNFFIEKAHDEGFSVDVSALQIRTDSDIDFVINSQLYSIRPLQHATRTTKSDTIRILPIIDAQGDKIKMPLSLFWKKGRDLTSSEDTFVGMISGLYH
ncbi:MAG: LysR family transcriptional regulator [Raoultibacter sp.]